MLVLPACNYTRVLCCRHCRRDGRRWGRRSVHWRRERGRGAQEKGCYYQKTDTAHWGPSIVFLRPTSARVGIDSCWGTRSMRLCFVPNEYYSSITPRLVHVCDSYFPVLDQYSGDSSSSLIQTTGHQLLSLCLSLVEEEKSQLLGSLLTS